MAKKKTSPPKHRYRSKFEGNFGLDLFRRGVEFTFETEKIEWQPPTKKYTPDFILEKKDGSLMHIETKGRLTVADRVKMICVKEQHPELDIRIIFQNANVKLNRNSATRYKDWAKKNGFKWSEGTMPHEWIKEIR